MADLAVLGTSIFILEMYEVSTVPTMAEVALSSS